MNAVQTKFLLRAVRIEIFTVVWMIVEAAVAIGGGIIARSFLLIGFGLDSIIELVTGGILLWRLQVQTGGGSQERVEAAEVRSRWVVAIALAFLCLYILVSAVFGFVLRERPDTSLAGMAVSLAAVLVMPWLFFQKRRLAETLDSGALRGDAASSLTCGYMAAAVLVGVVLNALFGWWWAEDIAALVFLFWLIQETREAFGEASEGDSAD